MGVRISLLLLSVCLTASCGFFKSNFYDRSENYQKAKVEPALVIPEGLNGRDIQSIYNIPGIRSEISHQANEEVNAPLRDRSSDVDAHPVVLAPIVGAGHEKNIKIQSLGKTYWLLAQFRANTLWSLLQDFVQTQTLIIERAEPLNGILESSWQERPDKPGLYEKFLFQLTNGVQQGTAELSIVEVMRDAQSRQTEIDWTASSSVSARELDMLKRVARYLEARNTPPAVQQGAEHPRLNLQNNADGAFLNVGLSYERTWASLMQAINKAGFHLQSTDSSRGLFLVAMGTESQVKKSPGFLKRLVTRAVDSGPYAGDIYLQVKPAGKHQTAVFVRGADEQQPSKEQAQTILRSFMYYID